MDWFSTDTIIPFAIGMAILIGGHRLLKQWNPALVTRVLIGIALLGIGIGCGYYLIFVVRALQQHPILYGLMIGTAGLGINQVAAPLRAAAGGPV